MDRTPSGPRVSPIEVLIFGAFTFAFLNSLYHLFYDRQGFNPAALQPMAQAPTTERGPGGEAGGRAPASLSGGLQNLDVDCAAQMAKTVSASKIRLSGAFCSVGGAKRESHGGGDLAEITVYNEANKFTATVFSDTSSAKFSTDYIPLNAGKNPLKVEYVYRKGEPLKQDVLVTRE